MRKSWLVAIVLTVSVGCDEPRAAPSTSASTAGGSAPSGRATGAGSAAAAVSAAKVTASASNPAPASQSSTPEGYSFSTIEPLPDDCKTPWIIFGPGEKAGVGMHQWPFVEQAFLEHPQLQAVQGRPEPGQIRFSEFHLFPKIPRRGVPEVLLVGECYDGATCNRIGAMYEAVVRSGKLVLECREVPSGVEGHGKVLAFGTPAIDNDASKCARVAVCRHMLEPSISTDLYGRCGHSPFLMHLPCAEKGDCSAVVACAKP
jgi:hypothetical protein